VEGPKPAVVLVQGLNAIELIVSDGTTTSRDTIVITVVDHSPPHLTCPAAVKVSPQAGQCTVSDVGLGQPTASDNCGAATLSNDAPASFALGTTTVTWSALDAANLRASCPQKVIVQDAGAPALEASLDKESLWPPHHKTVDVGLHACATGTCAGPIPVRVTVYSDEPKDCTGDGHTHEDAEIVDGTLRLRPERSGHGNGRVYLIVVSAGDGSSMVVKRLTVTVPKSQSAQDVASVVAQAKAAREYCASCGTAPSGYRKILDGGTLPACQASNRPPQVNAGADQSIELPTNSVTLAGTVTDDGKPESGTLTATWTKVSGSGSVTFADASSPATTAAFSEAGTYVLRLGASDGDLSADDEVTVVVAAENQAPQVEAGPDRVIDWPGTTTVALDGTVTDDGLPAGSTVHTTWLPLSGPPGVTFANAAAIDTTATFPAPGEYELQLNADDTRRVGSDTVRVTVNAAPVVSAGVDQAIALPDPVALSGTATDDGLPRPSALTVAWSKVSGPGAATFASPTVLATAATFDVPGTYVLGLTAFDTRVSTTDTVEVTVLPGIPDVSVEDATVVEGQSGTTPANVTVRLSRPHGAEVRLDFGTLDGTASATCDYRSRYGTVAFAPGETAKTITVPVNGDLILEGNKNLRVVGFNPVNAAIVDAEGLVTIEDDDAANQAPGAAADRSPAPYAIDRPTSTRLAWSAHDPDAGDSLRYDVYLGTAAPTEGQTWSRACTAAGPARVGASSVLDAAGDRLLVFGGASAAGLPSDLLSLSGASGAPAWQIIDAGPGPEGRQDASLAFDAVTRQAFLYGGCRNGCTEPLGDTWRLVENGGAAHWEPLPSAPDARSGHTAVYAPAIPGLVVFGGRTAAGEINDVWLLRDAAGAAPAWESLSAAGVAPEARAGAAAAYDADGDRLFLFGGAHEDLVLSDLWVLEHLSTAPRWTRLTPSGLAPARRAQAVLGFDPGMRRLLLFGGTGAGLAAGTNAVFGDAWLVSDVDSDPAWVRMSTGDTRPAARFGAVAAYLPEENRFVLALGANNRLFQEDPTQPPIPFGDVWTLSEAMGRLPLVSAGQTAAEYAPTLENGATYLWRVVARDEHGATRGSAAWRFSVGPPALTVADASAAEGSPLAFVLTLSRPSDTDITVDYTTVDGTATSDTDYQAATRTQRIPADTTTATIAVATIADGLQEDAEQLTLRLSGVQGAILARAEALGTITDDDPTNEPPLVDVGADVDVVLPAALDLAATVSDDGRPEGSTLALSWSLIDGPAPVTFSAPTRATTTVSFTARGTYLLRLTADDGQYTTSDELLVFVSAVNQPPVVTAGADATAALPVARAVLRGQVSDDGMPEGNSLFLAWTVESEPTDGAVAFADTRVPQALATFSAPGTYVLRLTAFDGEHVVSDDVEIRVTGAPDLTVLSVDASGMSAAPGTREATGVVGAAIQNLGGPASRTFATTFFVDVNGSGALEPGVDTVLATSFRTGVGEGEIFGIAMPVTGTLRWASPRVSVFVDSGVWIAESDESNNIARSGPACAPPTAGGFGMPAIEWADTDRHAGGTPAIGDLDGDGVPEIVYIAEGGGGREVRAIRGSDGAEVLTIPSTPGRPIGARGHPAIGDIDGDGRLEILATGGGHLRAYAHDGALEWESAFVFDLSSTAPAIGDLDGDGVPEIVLGRHVFDNRGTLRWTGAGGSGSGFSSIADLDGDGRAEVIAGNTVYDAAGSIRWQQQSFVLDRYTAVADLDGDGSPEIVESGAGVAVLLADGTIRWRRDEGGGLPVIADFDGDGRADIGVAGPSKFLVYDGNGAVVWQVPSSESMFGASAFDFDGDGAAEAVVRDLTRLRVLSGRDGAELMSLPLANGCFDQSLPVVADVDADGEAEIVVLADGQCGGGTNKGIFVVGDSDRGWVRAPRIWNQHSYHIDNVEADGRIPSPEPPSWTGANSYRLAAVTDGCTFDRPELIPTFPSATRIDAVLNIFVRVENHGDVGVGPGVAVAFYDGDPAEGRLIGATTTTTALPAHGEVDVYFDAPAYAWARPLWVVIDDATAGIGRYRESDETNNILDSGLVVVPDANTAPLVSAGEDQTLELPVVDHALSGTVEDDGLPGAPLQIRWTQLSGPCAIAFDAPERPTTTIHVPCAGTFVLRLTADDTALSSSDEATLTVGPGNQAPVVNAGANAALVLPATTLALNGQVVDDGRPLGAITTAWSQVDGPATVVFGDASAAATAAGFPGAGLFTLRLTASDGEKTASDDVQVRVGTDPRPDLTLSPIDATSAVYDSQSLAISGAVKVRVRNDGLGETAAAVSLTFFEDRNRDHALDAGDEVLATATVPDLPAGADTEIAAELSGRVQFAGSLLFAFVDSGGQVEESNEDNNVADGTPACVPRPLPRPLTPQVEWRWEGSPVLPDSVGVIMTPAVMDMDGDGHPDLVFSTIQRGGTDVPGNLRAVSIADHREIFTVTSPMVWGPSQIAVGDIDGDGRPEVVAVNGSNNGLIAFEHDGTVKWETTALLPNIVRTAGPVLADLDGDGTPEIALGSWAVFDSDGSLRWRGDQIGVRPLAAVADLDLDGSPEVISDGVAHHADGSVYWRTSGGSGGFVAVANFDQDPFPEIVQTRGVTLRLLEHDGTLTWERSLPSFTAISPPAVGDVDGDGEPEIVLTGIQNIWAIETDGTVKWTRTTQDGSQSTPATVFDLDGDGRGEVLYGDEVYFFIYDGVSGETLFRAQMGSPTGLENPVVADVDGDGSAEIVVTASEYQGSTLSGIFIFGDAQSRWVGARPVWNQHTYHVTNVNDDGTIPAHERPSWPVLNGYRQQQSAPGGVVQPCLFAQPDLTVSHPRLGAARTVTVRVGNGGARSSGASVPVTFYDGDPSVARHPLATMTTAVVEAGAFEDLTFTLPPGQSTSDTLWIVVDDRGDGHGTVQESNEGNNSLDVGLGLESAGSGRPDLIVASVAPEGLHVHGQTLAASGTVSVDVRNIGPEATAASLLQLFDDSNGNGAYDTGIDSDLGTAAVPAMASGSRVSVAVAAAGTVAFLGVPVHAFVDSGAAIDEANEANNVGRSGSTCRSPRALPGALREKWAWTSSATLPAFVNVNMTPLVIDVDGDGIQDAVFVSTQPSEPSSSGHLRAISGRDGHEIFTVTDPQRDLVGFLAAGNIDADPEPEIVGMSEGNSRLVAFEHDGTFKWMSGILRVVRLGTPVIADLDGDGISEVIADANVVNGDGSTRFAPGLGILLEGGSSLVVDLDLDGTLEIVSYNTVYRNDGSLAFTFAIPVGASFRAIGQLDGDPYPEIVVTGPHGSVFVLEHDGAPKWTSGGPGSVTVTGPPTVADFDGDGEMEIGASIYPTGYAVFDTMGSLMWSRTLANTPLLESTYNNSTTAADLDGDGAFEIVHAGTAGLAVFRGVDGVTLYEEPALRTCEGRHSPVVADVDADGRADILMPASATCAPSGFGAPIPTGSAPGLHVLRDADGAWARTGGQWRQHDTHSLVPGTFRANAPDPVQPFAVADVTASHVSIEGGAVSITVTVRLGNAGAGLAPAGTALSFYDGDPRGYARLLGTVRSAGPIAPGGFVDLVLTLSPTASSASTIFVVADDTGGLTSTMAECSESNNIYDSGLRLNQAPAVSAGADQTVTDQATLLGTASDDGLPFGAAVTTRWTAVDAPGEVVFADATALSTDVTFGAPGVYTLALSGSDGTLTGRDEVVITVALSNRAPSVDAGVDRVISQPDTSVGLAGVVTDDGLPEGSAVTSSWSMVDGPAPVAFADPSSPTTTASLPELGTYVFRLTASDGTLEASDDITVTFTPPNTAPVVDAGPDVRIEWPMDRVNLQGSAWDDGLPEGSVFTAAWSVVGRPPTGTATIANPLAGDTAVTFSEPGTYILQLAASDGMLIVEDRVTVLVTAPNQAPQVNAGPDQTVAYQETAQLSGSIVDDGATGELDVLWTKESGDGSVAFLDPTLEVTGATFTIPGTYVLRLTVNDGRVSAFDEVTITVTPPNQAPQVFAGIDQSAQLPNADVALNGVANDDGLPSGSTLTTTWESFGPAPVTFGDVHALTTTATFTAPGAYVLRLVATDGQRSTADDVGVFVRPENQAPVVSAGTDQTVTGAPATAILSGTVTDDGLPDGTLGAEWSVVSAPASVTFANPLATTTSVTLDVAGTYTFRLTATDGPTQTSDDVVVTIVPGNVKPVVSAGTDVSITFPERTATLAGTVTDDGLPEGAAVTSTWTHVGGPVGTATIANAAAASTTVTFDAAGTYVFRLTASDTALSAFDDVTVTVSGTDPIGNAPVVQLLTPVERAGVTAPTMVTGTIRSDSLLAWRVEYRRAGETSASVVIGNGNTNIEAGTLATFDPTMLLNGLYEIRLVATDTAGRATVDSAFVIVRDNFKVGQFMLSFVDVEVAISNIPIRVTRTYDSRDKGKGDFGYGWRLDVGNVRVAEDGFAGQSWTGTRSIGQFPNYCLQANRPRVVTVTFSDGRTWEYEPLLTPSCQFGVPPDEVSLRYRPVPGTTTQGQLIPVRGDLSVIDRVAVLGAWPDDDWRKPTAPLELFDAITWDLFDPDKYLLVMPDGTELLIDQKAGLQRIRDLNNNTLTVTPAGITDTFGNGVVFQRDGQGRIAKITDPEQHAMTYQYDAAGDLVGFTDREQHTTGFTYHATPAHHLNEIKDPLGRTPIRNDYYPDGRIKSHTDAFGKTITYEHDLTGRQEVVTDRLGKTRVLHFDDRGNVTKEIQADGRQILRTFDARNNRTSETDPHDVGTLNPPKTTSIYDGQDNLLSMSDALSNETSYTYNSRQQVLTTKDPRGKITTNEYDPITGNLTKTIDATGHAVTFTYDSSGRLLKQSQMLNGIEVSAEYTPSATGIAREKDAEGHITTYVNRRDGLRSSQSTTRTLYNCTLACVPVGTETLTTQYEYDGNGDVTKVIDPNGTSTRTVYDEQGRQKSTFDKLGRETKRTYDPMGQVTKTEYPDNTTEESTYDAEGRRLTSKDRGGRITAYEYDDLGRLTKAVFPDKTFTQTRYDSSGRVFEAIDARLKSTFFGYDTRGRRTSTRDPLGHETVYGYDANGNQDRVRDPNQNTVTLDFDDLNRRTTTHVPDGSTTVAGYDAIGRRISERDQSGKLTRFAYDRVGRLVKVVDALSHETTYTYDECGNRLTQTDANGHTTAFEYDKVGRLTARILPDGKRASMTYDGAGNLKTKTDFMGRTTVFEYDTNNRLISKALPDGRTGIYTYTPTGRRETVSDTRGVTNYAYDVRDRLTRITQPGAGVLDFTYDENGNRLTITATAGGVSKTTSYTYDDASRLDHVIDPEGRIVDFDYDANGNRKALIYPNGTRTDYAYNTLNRLMNLTTAGPAGTVQSYAFTLGPAGNRERIDEHGGVAKVYGYDALYRLTGENVTIGGATFYNKAFTYDAVGNRQNQTTTGTGAAVVDYTYDTRDRLLTEGAQPYSYDDNGNLTSKQGEATYTWDVEDRLVRVDKAGTVVEHAYDADGNRVQTKVTPATGPPTITNYLVDTSGSLSHVVAELTDPGTIQALYVRGGDDLVTVLRPAGSTTSSRWYHADGIGSIRALTDEAGNVTDTYTYSAFGELLQHTGTDPQPYAFAGEPYDPNVGLAYHRARWLDPRVGRFVSTDPFGGIQFDPLSLHRYLYVHVDPVNRVDPSGLFENLSTAVQNLSIRMQMAVQNAVNGVWSWRYVIPLLKGLEWSRQVLQGVQARFPNLQVALEHGLRQAGGRIDMFFRTAGEVFRRIAVEGKGWNFDYMARFPERAQQILSSLGDQSARYALEYGDDLIYAFKQLPSTPAGQQLMTQARDILTANGVQRITFGVTQLLDEMELMLR